MASKQSIVPSVPWTVPDLNHHKSIPYIEYPLIYNATVTEEPFYVEHPFTFTTSDAANTTLYKWTGGSWSAITGMSNPDVIYAHGFFAVTTAANAYVSITEHVQE